MHLYLSHIDGIPCVKDISFSTCHKPSQPGWVTIAMQDYLVWWFSELGGLVVHDK